jgi:twitching motility protein PilT
MPGQPAGAGRSLAELCELVRVNGASDLFLSAGIAARVRVAGQLREVPGAIFSDDQILALFGEALSPARLETLEATGSVDLSFTPLPGARYRVNLYRQTNGLAAALRPLRSTPPTLDELNLPRDLTRLTGYQNGLVLFTGTAGAGKSTTLVALIEQLNQTQAKHVVSLEDPIEYLFQSRRALVHQREVGDHVADFASGLRAALRESPDVILLGEMRDRETTAAALTAAETGHLVLATLHASSAVVAIDRIIDIFPAAQQQQIRYQLSLVLRETVTQFLLQTVGGGARVPAYERMVVNDAIGSLIRDSRTHQMPSAIQTGRAEGMVPLELSLARLVQGGQVSLETARQVARDPGYLEELASLPRGSRL